MANQNDIRILFEQALRKHQAGHSGSAEKLYKRILGMEPNHRDSLHLLGVLRLEEKKYKDAISFISKALGLGRDVAAICFNLARAYEESGQLDAALAMFQRAQLQAPSDADTVFGIGCVFLAQGRNAEALDAFNKTLGISADHKNALNNRGLALKNLGRPDEALQSYVSALNIDPEYIDSMLNMATLIESLNRLEDAHEIYAQVLKVNPNHVGALISRGKYFSVLEQSSDAISCFEQVLAIDPTDKEVLPFQIFERCRIADWRDFDHNVMRMQRALKKSETAFQPFYLARLVDSPELMLEASKWMASAKKDTERTTINITSHTNRRIKVGYVSSDLHAIHPVCQVLESVLALHDTSMFDIHLFALPHASAETTPDPSAHISGTLHHLKGLTDEEKVKLIRNEQLDVAVDLNGFTKYHAFQLFKAGIAAVQVNYLGFPGSMGSATHDYIIGDSTLIPTYNFEYFTEKVVWLPNSFFPGNRNRIIAASCPSRVSAGLPADGFVFGCFSTIDRILPQVFASWMRILQAVDDSVFWLKEEDELVRSNILRTAEKSGLNIERIIFARRTESAADHLARLSLMDLCLDTAPYNAHSTALDCLIAGVPLLTLPGEIFASRVGASLLQACGLPELICSDRKNYEEIAVNLARNPSLLQSIKLKVEAARRDSSLFDTKTYTKHLEKAYQTMVERHSQNLPPEHFAVS